MFFQPCARAVVALLLVVHSVQVQGVKPHEPHIPGRSRRREGEDAHRVVVDKVGTVLAPSRSAALAESGEDETPRLLRREHSSGAQSAQSVQQRPSDWHAGTGQLHSEHHATCPDGASCGSYDVADNQCSDNHEDIDSDEMTIAWSMELAPGSSEQASTDMLVRSSASSTRQHATIQLKNGQIVLDILGNTPRQQTFDYMFDTEGQSYEIALSYHAALSVVKLYVGGQEVEKKAYCNANNAILSSGRLGCSMDGSAVFQGTLSRFYAVAMTYENEGNDELDAAAQSAACSANQDAHLPTPAFSSPTVVDPADQIGGPSPDTNVGPAGQGGGDEMDDDDDDDENPYGSQGDDDNPDGSEPGDDTDITFPPPPPAPPPPPPSHPPPPFPHHTIQHAAGAAHTPLSAVNPSRAVRSGWCDPWSEGTSINLLGKTDEQKQGISRFPQDPFDLSEEACFEKCDGDDACEQAVYSEEATGGTCYLGTDTLPTDPGSTGFAASVDGATETCYAKKGFDHKTKLLSHHVRHGKCEPWREGFAVADGKAKKKVCPSGEHMHLGGVTCSEWLPHHDLSWQGCFAKCDAHAPCKQAMFSDRKGHDAGTTCWIGVDIITENPGVGGWPNSCATCEDLCYSKHALPLMPVAALEAGVSSIQTRYINIVFMCLAASIAAAFDSSQ